MPRPPKTYVLFQGGVLVMIGTAKELAEVMDVKPATVNYWATETARKRGLKYCIAVTDEDMWRKVIASNAVKMNKACARICRGTRGLCRYTKWGCDDLGWCVKCRDLVAYRYRCRSEGHKEGSVADE